MSSIPMNGVIRNGRVEVEEPITLPEGTEVTITSRANGKLGDCANDDRPMTKEEIAQTLEAMARVEPFDMSDDDRVQAEAWEKQVNDYTIANMDKGIEDVLR